MSVRLLGLWSVFQKVINEISLIRNNQTDAANQKERHVYRIYFRKTEEMTGKADNHQYDADGK